MVSIHKRVLQFKRTPQLVKPVGKPRVVCGRKDCSRHIPSYAHPNRKYCSNMCAKLVQAEQRKLKKATAALRKRA